MNCIDCAYISFCIHYSKYDKMFSKTCGMRKDVIIKEKKKEIS